MKSNSNKVSEVFSVSGRHVWITGGAGILGSFFAKVLVENGAKVTLIDQEGSSVLKLAKEIASEFSGSCLGFEADVTQPSSIEAVVEASIQSHGPINVLMNNAATKSKNLRNFFTPFEDFNLDVWKEVIDVNLTGMFVVAQAVGKSMLKNGAGGSIIQTASIYGVVAPDPSIYVGSNYLGGPINTPAVYSASKAGVIGLTQHLATHWAKNKIRVNSLTPGGVSSGQNDTFVEKYCAKVPMGRMAKENDLAGAVLYLASNASSYVTGQNIVVDGGFTVW